MEDASEVLRRFAHFATDKQLAQETFCSSIHSFLTMDELAVAFLAVGFQCSHDEVRQIFREQHAEQVNYLQMDKFFQRVASYCPTWKNEIQASTPRGI